MKPTSAAAWLALCTIAHTTHAQPATTGVDTVYRDTAAVAPAQSSPASDSIGAARDSVHTLPKVVVTGERGVSSQTGVVNSNFTLTDESVQFSPGTIGDIMRVLQATPSTVPSYLTSGGNEFVVRGGRSQENLYVVDGVVLENVSHFGGMGLSWGGYGFVNGNIVESIEMVSGGAPASLPQALSSVSSVKLSKAAEPRYRADIGLSLSGVGLQAEGPLFKGRAAYLLSGQYFDMDWLSWLDGEEALVKLGNVTVKAVARATDKDSFQLNGFFVYDKESEELNHTAFSTNVQFVGALAWYRQIAATTLTTRLTGRTWKNLFEDVDRDDTLGTYDKQQSAMSLEVAHSVPVRKSDQIEWGLAGTYSWNSVRDEFAGYYDMVQERYFVGIPPWTGTDYDTNFHVALTDFDSTVQSASGGAYAQYTLRQGPVQVTAGIRDDYYRLLRDHAPGPRLSAMFSSERVGVFSLSGGIYGQFPRYLESEVARRRSDVADSGLVEGDAYESNKYGSLWEYEPQRNYQCVLGYRRNLGNTHDVSCEGYFKWYDRELNHVTPFEMDPALTQDGHKRAYGLELFFRRKKPGKLYYSLSYALFKAEEELSDGTWYEASYSLRNSLDVIVGATFLKVNGVALQLSATEGSPYTPIDLATSLANRSPYDGSIPTFYDASDGWNTSRRDPVFVLNARYTLTFRPRWGEIGFYIDANNLLNQTPVVDQYIDGRTRTLEDVLLTGIWPAMGLHVMF